MKSLLFLSICVFFLLLAGNLHLIQAEDDFLRLPGSEVAAAAASASAPTNIVGRDGLCLDVANNNYDDGTLIQLYPCKKANTNNRNQLWTFESDGTIRSNGKCMNPAGNSVESKVVIITCDRAIRGFWSLDYFGSITNLFTGLVLSSENDTASSVPVTMEIENYTPFQGWTAANYTKPIVNYIISGFNGNCMHAVNPQDELAVVDVRSCQMRVEPRQQYALYPDRSIRLFSNRSLCLMTQGILKGELIRLFPCEGYANYRWSFVVGEHIISPQYLFFMNVRDDGVIDFARNSENPRLKWYTKACPDCPYITL